MKFKRFEPKDLVYNTIVAKPEYNFLIHSGNTYHQYQRSISGSFSNKLKHINSGEISLHELNIDRPADSMIYSFIEKETTRYAYKSVSTSTFDDAAQFSYGDVLTQSYPITSSLSRIYVPAGPEFSSSSGLAHSNKKYIRSLTNVLRTQGGFSYGLDYGNLGTSEVNMICIPGIFYGSGVQRGSIRLKYSITGSLLAEAADINKDGRLIQTSGSSTGSIVGSVIYNQGIILLTSSDSLNPGYTDFYSSSAEAPAWTNFATGLRQIGTAIDHTSVTGSEYSIRFEGTNKIPTLTMYAYAKEGEFNHSSNPTFIRKTTAVDYSHSSSSFIEHSRNIKKINKSPYSDHEEEFENITYISKIGIYDKDKNLIAVASLARPVKKTEKRELMFKVGIDF